MCIYQDIFLGYLYLQYYTLTTCTCIHTEYHQFENLYVTVTDNQGSRFSICHGKIW